ncbi:MAG: hypothetical protein AVDCRST_MAG19-2516 [uncultured Thermomicrobiales bacterium]|uniref:5'-deoxynucleotidase n=1 Tax=uncultured Thermomicrobiales bacterium TaxID=1645740 RepID=A0A6J4V9Z3_9BACT|nr:MAG: hypothetical protein AVDCRST_MAG19-2516 [uncultured Thermomicrobiales bacterium]
MPPTTADRPAAPPPGPIVGLARFLRRVGRLKTTPRTGWLDRGVPTAAVESVADHSFRTALLAWLAAKVAADTAAGAATGASPHPADGFASGPSLGPALGTSPRRPLGAADGDTPSAVGRRGAGLDTDRVLKLALIHDLAESLTGDPPPYDPATIPPGADARRRFLDGRHVRAPDRAAAKRAAEDAAMADLLADLPPSLAADLAALWAELAAGDSAESRFVKQADKLETFLQSRDYLATDPARPMASFAAEVAEVVTHPTLAALRDAMAAPTDAG